MTAKTKAALAAQKAIDPDKPVPVRLDLYEWKCGLLWPLEKAKSGYGVVQLGSGGPFQQHKLDDMTPISWEEFDRWQYRR